MTLDFVLCNNQKISFDNIIEFVNDKKWCAENSLFTVDAMSLFIGRDVNKKIYIFAVNMNKPENKVLIDFVDSKVIKTSMSDYSMRKFRNILKKNRELLLRECEEIG